MAESTHLSKQERIDALIHAANDTSPVTGLTHNFYRYPARFSPKLAKACIEAFTEHGDLVLDPFVGGGTTLVEALALGRDAIGVDISSLATFVSEVKTTIFSQAELDTIRRWATRTSRAINIHADTSLRTDHERTRYLRYLDGPNTWRLRKAIAQCLRSARRLGSPRLEALARCIVLRTAQWALDGRKRLPNVEEFRKNLLSFAEEMVDAAKTLADTVAAMAGSRSAVRCITRSSNGLEDEEAFKAGRKPKLVLTSPPYPGVHVLYHRWQVDGRKETPAPFWIANRLDGDGAAYYTMGDRHAHELKTYFNSLRKTLSSIAALSSPETTIIQVVAFAEPSWQLPRYLSVADDAGLKELFLPQLKGTGDGRLWRQVPNRRWYADQRGETNGSQEVVLIHRVQ